MRLAWSRAAYHAVPHSTAYQEIAYNALRVVRTAMAAVHGQQAADQVSEYCLTELVITTWVALDIFASPEDWTNKFADASASAIASTLTRAAQHVDMHPITKTTRDGKKFVEGEMTDVKILDKHEDGTFGKPE
ncbi:MAG: hypothetical protein WD875_01175 [Pirellulales bacterium]